MENDNVTKRPLLQLFFRYWDGYKKYAITGPIFKVLEVVFDLLVPLVVAKMVDLGVKGNNIQEIKHLGLMLVFMTLIGFVCTVVAQGMAAIVAQGVGGRLREATYNKVCDISKSQRDTFGVSSLLTRITSDINQIQLAVALGNRQLIRWPILAIGSVVAAININKELGLVFLICTPLVGFVFYYVISHSIPEFKAAQTSLDDTVLISKESLSGAREIRAFVEQDTQNKKFSDKAQAYASHASASGKISSLLNPATFLIMDLGICAILSLSSNKIYTGTLEQGQILAFVNYMTQTLLAVGYVANLVVVFTKGSASASRVLQVLDTTTSIEYVKQSAGRIDDRACAIELCDVSFTYPNSQGSVLKNINLSTEGCTSLGVIGATGSGKSTLLCLLARFYDVSSGEVKLFDRNIKDYTKQELSDIISYIPQTPSLVAGTLRQNLTWRDIDATDKDIYKALDTAQASEFVSNLEDGLESSIEVGGANFSGGQRQRLSIARALVSSPKIVLMDAATSALDFKTSANLSRALEENYPDIFSVVVSERVGTVSNCDKILVLSHGEVVGFGSHDYLKDNCSQYIELIESQSVAGKEVING